MGWWRYNIWLNNHCTPVLYVNLRDGNKTVDFLTLMLYSLYIESERDMKDVIRAMLNAYSKELEAGYSTYSSEHAGRLHLSIDERAEIIDEHIKPGVKCNFPNFDEDSVVEKCDEIFSTYEQEVIDLISMSIENMVEDRG